MSTLQAHVTVNKNIPEDPTAHFRELMECGERYLRYDLSEETEIVSYVQIADTILCGGTVAQSWLPISTRSTETYKRASSKPLQKRMLHAEQRQQLRSAKLCWKQRKPINTTSLIQARSALRVTLTCTLCAGSLFAAASTPWRSADTVWQTARKAMLKTSLALVISAQVSRIVVKLQFSVQTQYRNV